ncbi:hypothetical protein DERF_005478 [Dermatophagoides farinae]|uniref:Uncharacterized protein n=1 Tax=Dermatophagoides farinae TaxID=6954 RepID=A0A922I434_DERFA|nr:hypothetical protein DERF_005478 [Dermatophagoides farinae]
MLVITRPSSVSFSLTAEWTSCRNKDGANGDKTRSPFGRIIRKSCISDTAVPSESDHQTRIGCIPVTLHGITAPVSLRK